MSVTVDEKFESRESTDGKSVELVYVVRGTDSDTEAMAALKAAAPATYGGLLRQRCRIEPEGPQLWTGVAPYELSGSTRKDPLEAGESSLSFDTSGGTQHITQGLTTVHKYAPEGQEPPNFKGAIGVTHDNVEGVDIGLSVFKFSKTKVFTAEQVDQDYVLVLADMTYTVNDSSFMGFEAGELLFTGAVGSQRGDGNWEIAFHFEASPNRTNLVVGDITGIAKKGWQYMWVYYEEVEDPIAKMLVRQPRAVYVEQVYYETDFTQLGL